MHKVHSFDISTRKNNVTNNSGWLDIPNYFNNAVFLEARLPLVAKIDCVSTVEELLSKYPVLQSDHNSIEQSKYLNIANTLIEYNNQSLDCNAPPITAGDISSESSESSQSTSSSSGAVPAGFLYDGSAFYDGAHTYGEL